MLTSTFLHIPGVGRETEQRLWKSGIVDWDTFSDRALLSQLPPSTIDRMLRYLDLSRTALEHDNLEFFANLLPPIERWRLYSSFPHQFGFLDIETTGLSRYYDEITVIGLMNNAGYHAYIRHNNLCDAIHALSDLSAFVTFNGTLFDLPFIRSALPWEKRPAAHLDLRFLLARIGVKGPLKHIEQQVGIGRPEDIKGLDGLDATLLWYKYCKGDKGALLRLCEYNFFDVRNLRLLLAVAIGEMTSRLVTKFPALESACFSQRELPALWEPPWPEVSALLGQFRDVDFHEFRINDLLALVDYPYPRVVGIDLTGSEKRASGWALLEGTKLTTMALATDHELLDATRNARPHLVSIDAPLTVPMGRDCVEDTCDCRRFGITRVCERLLRQRGIMVYPCLLPSMQGLTARGIRLASALRGEGIDVIESYPGAAQDMLHIPRKKASLPDLRQALRSMCFTGTSIDENITHDEIDAITSALVGYLHLARLTEALGDPTEGQLIIPSRDLRAMLRHTSG